MKRLLLALLLLLALGGLAFAPIGRKAAPMLAVVRGNTLSGLARTHHVTVSQLKSWNGLSGDGLEVGQVLALGETGTGRPLWEIVAERLTALLPAADEAVVVASDAPSAPIAVPHARRPMPRGRSLPTEGADEADRAGEADDILGEAEQADRIWPPLRAPPPKPCLDPFAVQADGDRGIGRSEGLSSTQVKAAVAGFQEETLRCAQGHDLVQGQVGLELAIGCDGVVRSAEVLDDSVPVDGFARCVADVMRYAPFPAHARDEVVVQVPLRYH